MSEPSHPNVSSNIESEPPEVVVDDLHQARQDEGE